MTTVTNLGGLLGLTLSPIRVYNTPMSAANVRRIVGVILLLVSLALLAWGMWPLESGRRTLPVEPTYMTLPTPQGWLFDREPVQLLITLDPEGGSA
jgi:hypothetical protein